MAYSTLERWTGSAWVNETALIRLSVNDKLYSPSYISVTIADPNGTVAANYFPFQKVRIKEGSTKIILFYGKIRNIVPENDLLYGHIVLIEARDNLAELEDRYIEVDYALADNSAWGRKSALITSLISGYSSTHSAHSFSGNIDTTTSKVTVSAVNETGTIKWAFNSEGSGKNVLATMKQLAEKDPHSSNKEAFGYTFHLDYRTSGNTVYSDFNYRKRGADPAGASASYGLVVELSGVEAGRSKAMFADYSFETDNVQELVTRVDVSWVDADKKPQKASYVLVNTGTHSGTFTLDETISWSSGAHTAKLRSVGGTGSSRHLLISDFTVAGLAALPGLQITGGTSTETATANASNVSPPGVLSVAIEQDKIELLNMEDYEAPEGGSTEIYLEALASLYMFNDSVERGDFRVSKWPYFTLTGTHTGSNNSAVLIDSSKTFTNNSINLGTIIENADDGSSAEVSAVANTQITGTLSGGTDNDWDTGDAYNLYKLIRVGESIQIVNSRLSINKEFIITSIEYDEGGGVLQSSIRVLSIDRGSAERKNPSFAFAKKAITSSGTKRSGIPLSQQSFISTVAFLETDYNTVSWTTGALTYGDGTAYAISSTGNTGNMANATTPYYIYFDAEASTTALQSTTTHANVVGKNKSLLATVFAGVTTVDPPQIRVQQGSLGSPAPKTFVQTAAPTDTATNPLRAGDIWFDSDDGNNLYRWSGSAWVSQRDTTIATAQTAADAKARTYIGGTPSGMTEGDIWIDTNNGSMLKRWNGSAWVDAESFLTNTWTNAGRTRVLGGVIETNLIVLNSATGSAANTANIMQNLTSSPGSAAAGTNRILLSADGIFGINSSNATNFAITQASGGAAIFGGGTVVMDSGGMTMTNGGYVRSAGKTFNSTTAGFWLGYTGGAYKFEIGETDGNYLQWNGSALVIKGSFQISGGSVTLTEGNVLNTNTSAGDVGLSSVENESPNGQLTRAFALSTQLTAGKISMRVGSTDVITLSGATGSLSMPGTIVKTGYGSAATFQTTSYTDSNSQTRGGGLYMDADGLYSVANTGSTGTRAPLLFAGGNVNIGSTSRALGGYLMAGTSSTGYRVFLGGEGLYVGTKDDIISGAGSVATGGVANQSGAIMFAGNWYSAGTGLPTSSFPRMVMKSYGVTEDSQTTIIPQIRFNNDTTFGIHNYTATGADAFENYFGPNIYWSTGYKVTAGASPTSGSQSFIDAPLAYLALQMPEQLVGWGGDTAYTMPTIDASGDNIKAMIAWYGYASNSTGGGADFLFSGGGDTSVIIAAPGGLWMTNRDIKNVGSIRFAGGDSWSDYRTGPAIEGSSTDTADYQIVLPPIAGTTTNNTLVVDSVSGSDLIMVWEAGGGGSGDITSVVAGTGLTGGATSGAATLNVIGGTGITANADDIAIDSTVATLTGSQTLTNKTLTTPTIAGDEWSSAQHTHAGSTTGGTISGGGSGDITGVTLAGDSGTAEDLTANVNLTIAGGTNVTTSGSGSTLTINAGGNVHSHDSSTDVTGDDVYLNGNLVNYGDTDTYVAMWVDRVLFYVGNTHMLDLNNNSSVNRIGLGGSGGSGYMVRIHGDLDVAAGNSMDGDIDYDGTLTGTSDSRKKTNIVDFSNSDALALISNLRPRTFNKLGSDGNAIDKLRYGLIAQEVEDVLTGLSIDKTKSGLIKLPATETIEKVIDVDGNTETVINPRRLSYLDLVAPLIGAIKELKTRIEVLEGG